MNTWTHPTNSRIALGPPVGTFSSNKPEFFELGTFRTNRKVARRCIAREHTTQQSVNILIRDTYIWVGFHSQCLFSLTPFFRLKKRQIHIRRIHFILPSFGQWSDTASTRLGPTETWLASNKTSAILDSQSAGLRRSFAQVYYWTRFLECFFENVLWGVVSLMTTRTVLVLATVVSIRDKFFYPCCARCHKKVYFRDAEATMWVRRFDCFQMQQHYTRSLNVKFLCCCWLFVEQQALQSYQCGK